MSSAPATVALGRAQAPLGSHAGFLGSTSDLAQRRSVSGPRRRLANLSIRAAKRVKGPRGGGGGAATKTKPQKGGGGGGGSYKSPGDVRDGAAYEQETRKIILSLDRVSKVAPNGKQILKNVGLGMYLGAKIGVLGANGAGKSTVMRILAGEDTNFDGDLVLSPGIRVRHLEQEPQLDSGATVMENIEPALKEIKGMLKEFEDVSLALAEDGANTEKLMARMDRLQNAIEAANGWELDRQMERAMDALRCPPADALVENLSGGERRRVALTRLVLESPDILLLDEPTNHLDAQSVSWLEQFLRIFPGTVVSVTHDRYFLDEVAGWILELDRGQGIPFQGNYSEWLSAKQKRMEGEKKQQNSLSKAVAEELEWIRSNQKGQQKKGKARLRQYDELMAKQQQYTEAAVIDSITIPLGPRLGNQVVELDGVTKSFGDRLLIDGLSCSIPPGAVVGIVGPNGTGKSTLFRMIMGEEVPDSGSVKLGETVVPMYVDQSREGLDDDKTVYEAVSGGDEELQLGPGRIVQARQYLSWYNFTGSDQQKKVGVLSGGERNRLQLAIVLRQSGNLLLLDEPTNDLDVDTLRALEEAILNFAGTVLVISHDRWFLNRISSHILAFEGDSNTVWFEGGYSEYDEDRIARTGVVDPTRVKFRRLA
mmetsp:Transcript_6359/g.17783  ORF Transcript_6359/g.17783 Transcript_6359/m.17783 type:complete len:652 (+) Transcript_6359:178-2133(+)